MVGGSLILFAVSLAGWFLLTPPNLVCQTHQFTTCTEAEIQALQRHYRRRWSSDQDISAWRVSFPHWEEVKTSTDWQGRTKIVITRSQPIITIQIGEEWRRVLSAGQVETTDEASWPAVRFANSDVWQAWRSSYPDWETAAEVLKTLATTQQSLRPRATQIEVRSQTEAEIRLENTSRAIVSLESAPALENQLRTLQAVFTSSTMEQLPTEVDLRFKNVIVR